MSTLSATPVNPVAAVHANAVEAWRKAAHARAEHGREAAIGLANEAKATAQAAGQPQSASELMSNLSMAATVAAAMNSMPAALNLMGRIALASGSGQLDAADVSTLQTEYAQLTQQVAAAVGSTSAGAQADSSSAQSGDSASSGTNPDQGEQAQATGVDATRPEEATPPNTQDVHTDRRNPTVEKVVTRVTTTTALTVSAPMRTIATVRTHEAHVGTDVEQPAATTRPLTRVSVPEAIAQFQQHVTTIRVPMSVVSLVA